MATTNPKFPKQNTEPMRLRAGGDDTACFRKLGTGTQRYGCYAETPHAPTGGGGAPGFDIYGDANWKQGGVFRICQNGDCLYRKYDGGVSGFYRDDHENKNLTSALNDNGTAAFIRNVEGKCMTLEASNRVSFIACDQSNPMQAWNYAAPSYVPPQPQPAPIVEDEDPAPLSEDEDPVKKAAAEAQAAANAVEAAKKAAANALKAQIASNAVEAEKKKKEAEKEAANKAAANKAAANAKESTCFLL